MMDHEIAVLFRCPDCGLLMSRMEQVPVSEHWTERRCWFCGHVFGGFSDRGSLDLGPTEEHG